MSVIAYNRTSVMLDYVRKNCDIPDGEKLDFEGEFEEDPEVQRAWEQPLSQEYHGEGRFVNMGPAGLRRMEANGVAPEDQQAFDIAQRYWGKNNGFATEAMEAGWVEQGEPREAIVAQSMVALGRAVSPVAHIFVHGALSIGGMPSINYNDEPSWCGIFDFNLLAMDIPDEEPDDIGLMFMHDVDEVVGF